MDVAAETVETERTRSAVAYVGAAAFVAAAAWYGLVVTGVTVESEPTFTSGQGFDERLGIYYRWFGSTVQQEAFYGGIAIFGFVCLGATALFVWPRLASHGGLASLGAQGIGLGAALWVVGIVEQLGGHQAIARMVDAGHPLETVNSVKLTIDTVNDAFQLAASLLIGAGLLAFAAVAGSGRWRQVTLAVALVVLALAGAYAARAFDVVDLLLVLAGVVALPAWLVWSGRELRSPGAE